MTSASVQSPEATFYTWSFPGSPVRVRLDLGLVGRMQRHLKAGPDRGLLMGRSTGSGATEITDFHPLLEEGMPSSAPAAARAEHPGLSVVGYYRSHPEPDLRLNDDDLALAGTFFAEPHCVLLLIGPATAGQSSASFFFWDEGQMNGEFAFLEFPFDAAPLATAEHRRIQKQERQAPQAGAAGAPGKKSGVLKGAVLLLTATVLLTGAALGVRWYLAKPPLPAIPKPVSAGRQVPPITFSLKAERQGSDLRLSWDHHSPVILNATAGQLSVVEGNAKREIGLDPDHLRSGSVLYSPTTDQVRMELAILRPDGTTGRESVLVILPQKGPLRLQPIRVVAPPPQQALSGTESRRALAAPATAPAPQPTPSITLAEPPGPATMPESGSPAPVSSIANRDAAPPQVAAPRLPIAGVVPLVASPVASSMARPADVSSSTAPPASPPASSNPASGTAARPVLPEPIHKVMPVVPPLLKRFLTQRVAVQVRVAIDETGKVVKASPVPQRGVPAWLATATATAAEGWKFRPARAGDVPVPSDTVLEFVFQGR